jgi:hypothetical protein
LKELQNIGEIAFMLLSISSVVFTSNIWWNTFFNMSLWYSL